MDENNIEGLNDLYTVTYCAESSPIPYETHVGFCGDHSESQTCSNMQLKLQCHLLWPQE